MPLPLSGAVLGPGRAPCLIFGTTIRVCIPPLMVFKAPTVTVDVRAAIEHSAQLTQISIGPISVESPSFERKGQCGGNESETEEDVGAHDDRPDVESVFRRRRRGYQVPEAGRPDGLRLGSGRAGRRLRPHHGSVGESVLRSGPPAQRCVAARPGPRHLDRSTIHLRSVGVEASSATQHRRHRSATPHAYHARRRGRLR